MVTQLPGAQLNTSKVDWSWPNDYERNIRYLANPSLHLGRNKCCSNSQVSLNPPYNTYLCPIFVPEWVPINRADNDIAQPYLPLFIFPQAGGSCRLCAVNQGWMKVNVAETTKLQWRIQSAGDWDHRMSNSDFRMICMSYCVFYYRKRMHSEEHACVVLLVLAVKCKISIRCKAQRSGCIFHPIYLFDRLVSDSC